MEDNVLKALAVVVGALFFMVIIMPIAGLSIWLAGVVLAFLLVPVAVFLALRYSQHEAGTTGQGLFEERGLTPEEWTEKDDPDDFEGEID